MNNDKPKFKMLDPKVPVVFTDGSKVYDELAQLHKKHGRGYFILAPSGAGKTHFVKNQTQPDWIDGDDIWMMTNAHPEGAWWLEPLETIKATDARSDVITYEAKKLGFRIVGASNNWLKPDAIVVPDWETHKAWIAHRENNNYDGGATSDRLEQVKNHIDWILKWEDQGVPKFKTVPEAAEFLAAS